MKVLVTGGAGFIGSHLVRELLDDVRVVDNFSTGSEANLSSVADEVDTIRGDLRDENVARAAVMGREVVFHQAALPSVPRSVKNPKESVENNVIGTTVLLKEAVDAGVRRFVYAGSSSAYGNCREDPKVETITPRVLSPYAASKLSLFCRRSTIAMASKPSPHGILTCSGKGKMPRRNTLASLRNSARACWPARGQVFSATGCSQETSPM